MSSQYFAYKTRLQMAADADGWLNFHKPLNILTSVQI